MALHWHNKPKALGQLWASPPFFSALSPFQRSSDSNGMIGLESDLGKFVFGLD